MGWVRAFFSLRKQIMASKITLGKRPQNFKSIAVKFTLPDGETGIINVVFQYRTRSEFGAYLNQLFATSDAEKPVADEKPDFVDLFAKAGEKTVSQLLDAMKSWDFEHELSKETLVQLGDEIPAALAAIGSAYNAACTEGKLGN